MPEYLAPGVYVEEVSFRAKTIEGVSTSTAGFVGPARYGPVSGTPELVTSFAEFERVYGGLDPLTFGSTETTNFLAHGVRAFFEEGGKRLYVARVYNPSGGGADSGKASFILPTGAGDAANQISLFARFPGRGGNMRVTFTVRVTDNVLFKEGTTWKARRIQEHDTVLARIGATNTLYDVVLVGDTLQFRTGPAGNEAPVALAAIIGAEAAPVMRIVTAEVTIEKPIIRPERPAERFGLPETLANFTLNPNGARSLKNYFVADPPNASQKLALPFELRFGANVNTGAEIGAILFGAAGADLAARVTAFTATVGGFDPALSFTPPSASCVLGGGSDGNKPAVGEYQGSNIDPKKGLGAFEDLEDISIVAAPGYSFGYTVGDATAKQSVEAIQGALISHAERMRYRIAVLDAPDKAALSEVRAYRGKVDSTYAALYYPWVKIFDPLTNRELNLPPSGFVAGIYARNDVEFGVHKAPANEVVRLSIGFETTLNKAQQDVLNPEGINCFRFFEGRGYRLWGARTASSDPEWKDRKSVV